MTLQITYRRVDSLTPYIRNARTHSDEQVAQIAGSIKEFGFTNPVLIEENGGIIAGHGRVMAAQRLGLAEVPTITLPQMTDAQRRAYILADNKLALNAGWDVEMLKVELGELNALDFDLTLTGFSLDELGKLLVDETDGLTDPDDVPEAPAYPVAELNDVWVLGRHRLVCGDSTTVESVDRALNGVKPHLMVTDPPYGVEYDPTRRRAAQSEDSKPASGVVMNDDRASWTEAWALFPGEVVYVWHAMKTASVVHASLEECGFELRSEIVWAKTRATISPKNMNPKTAGYNPQHECCFYAIKKGGHSGWSGDRSQTTLWSIEHSKSETGHSTQKPVDCMKRPIENNSSPGQAIYEPFSGSGTTIIACEMTGRSCHAIELNPAYVDVAILRWQEFTGQIAVLEGDGRTFTEVLAERQPDKVLVAKAPSKPSKAKKGKADAN
ncbi:ParB/Sulfiredoxin [uncultured Caudovirales phage]|uniref:ParB/Sulfiredoxin n=1 Tax=uncultured Caudovirales phage TaxID=2100421 RepID=A0A6J5KMA4_9CAUD|nr:ParB/Sulfiredoxin [uncultured Caudovirales phage]